MVGSRDEETSHQRFRRRNEAAGAEGEGSSPNRLLQSTVGDEMKMSGKGGKVVGVSIKDRAAILPSGHMADGAYWFDGKTGNFVSSTFYFAALPEWVAQFNASRPADKYAGKTWMGKTMAATPDAKFYAGARRDALRQ